MKIEHQQRDKLKNSAVLFAITDTNRDKMLYALKLINKRYKRCDYVAAYTSSNLSKGLDSLFHVTVKLSGENTQMNIIKSFIKSCSYRRVMIICDDIIMNTDNNGAFIRLPVDMPRKGYWFDFYNVNISLITPSQRKSANKAYQTCRHTCMYLDIGKEKSKTRERIIKRYDKIGDNIDNFLILKQKVNLLECKNEKIQTDDILKIFKKLKKIIDNFKQLNEVINTLQLKMGSYGLELSKKRDYSIVDARIKDQLKIAAKKLAEKQAKAKSKPKQFPKPNQSKSIQQSKSKKK